MNWKSVKNYEGYYEVSDTGLLRSVRRLITRSNGRSYYAPSVVLKTFISKTANYQMVQLSKHNIPKKFMVHRLVAQAFLELDINSDMEVNHIDGNRYNNCVTNLEVITHQQNIDHSIRMGLKNDYGEKSSNAKLTNQQAKEIREAWKQGMMQKDLAKKYGVSKQTICRIVNNKVYFR